MAGPPYRKQTFWILCSVAIFAVVGIITLLSKTMQTLELPDTASVTSVEMEQFNDMLTVGRVTISDKERIGSILPALTGARKTLRYSVNDHPARDNYLVIMLIGKERTGKLFLYSEGSRDYVEEPYAGIYRISRDSSRTLYQIYSGNSSKESNDGEIEYIENDKESEDKFGDRVEVKDMPDTDGDLPGDDKSIFKDGTVWVEYYENSFVPVSHVADGKQQLLNEGSEWYFEIQKRFGFDDEPVNAVIIDTRKMYADPEQNPYDFPLPDEGWISRSLRYMGDEIAMSGDWEPFIVTVRYECYSLQSQPDIEIWQNYFKEKIGEVSTATPVIIKNAWFFDIDGDGREESVVNASNTVVATGLEMYPPAAENTATYTLTAYFSSDGTAIDLGGRVFTGVSLDPVNMENDIYESYTIDENSPEFTQQFIAAYQYDADGNITLCPIFNYGEFDRWPEQSIVLADIDGDGKAELLTMFAVIYAPITVYRFNENWKPQAQFAINTPA